MCNWVMELADNMAVQWTEKFKESEIWAESWGEKRIGVDKMEARRYSKWETSKGDFNWRSELDAYRKNFAR